MDFGKGSDCALFREFRTVFDGTANFLTPSETKGVWRGNGSIDSVETLPEWSPIHSASIPLLSVRRKFQHHPNLSTLAVRDCTSHNDWADNVIVNPPVDPKVVFECKYEIDSLCGFLKLSRAYYQSTGDSSFINENWKSAVDQIFRVIHEQSQPSFDENFNFISYFNWTGSRGSLSPRVNNRGNNEPKAYTGLVGTSHRPSDDLTVYGEDFSDPANAMLSVELVHLADVLDKVDMLKDISTKARETSSRIKDAIWNTTVRAQRLTDVY
ncbi:hypothetical protein DFP72DRAFT_1085755 [Ephemerocybe angulata]|uniref:Uncharacterized protein n=1 Tax=Ephemerocybe angulata TaxID=980116 RepID=A0A8H6LSR9_9AGAR|nr:hypothetical protein DFP72DRAFT_1085755 [Tulosesus angulatus]